MKIFLDTANMEEIIKYNKMGLLDGIFPTLLSSPTGMNPQEVMKDFAKFQCTNLVDKIIAAQVSP